MDFSTADPDICRQTLTCGRFILEMIPINRDEGHGKRRQEIEKKKKPKPKPMNGVFLSRLSLVVSLKYRHIDFYP